MTFPATMRDREREKGRTPAWLMPAAAALLAFPMWACEGLLDVDLPGSLTEEALRDPSLTETWVTSAVGEFECGFVDMWYTGQWFEEWQNSGTGRPNALSQFRSALVGVYADPCSSGTGPIWTTIQVPRLSAARAVEFIRIAAANGAYDAVNAGNFPDDEIPDTTLLIARARLYEGYSIQLLAEQFCAVTLTPPSVTNPPESGSLVTREQAYDSAEVKFTEAIDKASTLAGAAAAAILDAARVGRARARLSQWQYAGGSAADVVADASAVTVGFQLLATYDDNPSRRRNRLFTGNNQGKNFHPYADWTNLRIEADGTNTLAGEPLQGTVGVADPRVNVAIASSTSDLDGRGVFLARRQMKFPNRAADIPFSSWREARLMIAEVDPTQTLAIINELRTDATGLPAGIELPAGGLPTIAQATWDAMTPEQRQMTLWEERRRELWLQGTQAGDKVRWAYPAWDVADEYGAALRDVTTIDDPLTTASTYPLTSGDDRDGCIPVPYLERNSNRALIAILDGA